LQSGELVLEFSRKTSRKNKEKHKKSKVLILQKIRTFLILKEKNNEKREKKHF